MFTLDKKFILSIQKASEILKLFLYERRPIGISEFSRKLDLPKSTIQGIIQTLVEVNYLERDTASNKYRLGPMMFQLGMSYVVNLDLINVARVWMEHLSLKVNEPVNTGILVGNKVIIIFRTEPEGGFSFFPQVGKVAPTHADCIGKMLYAHMSKDRRDRILSEYEFEAFTENSITSLNEFEKEMERVLKDGIAFENEEVTKGQSAVAGPIYNYSNNLIAAFSVATNTEKLNRKRDIIINEVQHTSQEVSSLLGYKRKNQ